METKDVVKRVLEDYQKITGLRSYVVFDKAAIQSASEKNYFCKCLKLSSKALAKCEECTEETYVNAISINKECIYSCHAGLIKWAVPVNHHDFHCVIVSEGILAKKQWEEADMWAAYLSSEYHVSKELMLETFKSNKTMNEDQMMSSIQLLKDLLRYHLDFQEEAEKTVVAG